VYWIRRCLHNYSDTTSINILTHLADALGPDSKLLIEEDILDNPPNPIAAVTDMMMMNFGGKQRNLETWQRIAANAGLRITGVFRGESTHSSIGVLECEKM